MTAHQLDSVSAVDRVPARAQVSVVVVAVFLVYLAQMSLNPVIAPLSRELGIAEWQAGAMISTAAVMVVATSQFWGRRSQSWGSRPVLICAMAVGLAAMGLFTFLGVLGMRERLTGMTLFVLLVLARGVLFGGSIAAVPPTAQSYVARVTSTAHERVRGMAKVGAAQGSAMVVGAALGGLLAGWSLTAALIAVPVALAVGLLVVVLRLRPEPADARVPDPAWISPRDPRVLPFLVAGFGMFTALGFVQVLTGFLVQDRLGLSSEQTGLVGGGALLAAGIGMVAAQAVLVPRLNRGPVTLLRIGCTVALAGFVLLVPAGSLAVLLTSMMLIGLGMGVATPGYAAGPTLEMGPDEQGGLAGLIGATNGLTFVVAPVLGTALYGVAPLLPVLLSAATMALVLLLVYVHPRLRRSAGRRVTPPVA